MHNDYSFQIVSPEEMQELRETIPLNKEHFSYDGFSLFHPNNTGLRFYAHYYIVAFHKLTNELSGVIKFSRKAYESDNVWSITYIEVKENHRCKGLSSSLYKALNEHVQSDMIVVGTLPTDDGQAYKVQEKRLNIITNCLNYKDYQDYYDAKNKATA